MQYGQHTALPSASKSAASPCIFPLGSVGLQETGSDTYQAEMLILSFTDGSSVFVVIGANAGSQPLRLRVTITAQFCKPGENELCPGMRKYETQPKEKNCKAASLIPTRDHREVYQALSYRRNSQFHPRSFGFCRMTGIA